jgi:hypothetical protein
MPAVLRPKQGLDSRRAWPSTRCDRGARLDGRVFAWHDSGVDLHPRFAPFFPIGDGLVRLEVVEPYEGSEPGSEHATVVVRLLVFDEGNEGLVVRNIKEQQLFCGPVALYEDATRVDEMLYAQQEVLGEALRGPVDAFEALMPHELCFFGSVMSLVRARTRDDFARALRVKSRLGRYLGPG